MREDWDVDWEAFNEGCEKLAAFGVAAGDVTPEMILEWVAGIADVMMQGTET